MFTSECQVVINLVRRKIKQDKGKGKQVMRWDGMENCFRSHGQGRTF